MYAYRHTQTTNLCTVEPQLLNDLSLTIQSLNKKNWVKNAPGIKHSEFEHTSRVDENGMCVNDCWGKSNLAEWLVKSTWAALFQFSNKLVVDHNFATNYVWQ